MKVGILGSGDVAKSLAKGFLDHNHDVMLGARVQAAAVSTLATPYLLITGAFFDLIAISHVLRMVAQPRFAPIRGTHS